MSNKVYANKMAVACKAGDGKVISAFPDVCMSPPSPPAGPIPVPYPASSFSRDLKKGSKTVKINGKPVALKDQSFYASSPLGDEAATRSFGASVLSHGITGKTYFAAYSFDVKIEGKNVCRHLDLTTSNHSSYPGGTPPFAQLEEMALLALSDGKEDLCPCCWKAGCKAALSKEYSTGEKRDAYSFREWYRLNEADPSGNLTATGRSRAAELSANTCLGGSCPNAGKASDARKSDPPCDVYRVTSPAEGARIVRGIDSKRKKELRVRYGVPETSGDPSLAGMPQRDRDKAVQIDHRTPRTAGGCPTSESNTVANATLCPSCQKADDLLDSWSAEELAQRRSTLGLA